MAKLILPFFFAFFLASPIACEFIYTAVTPSTLRPQSTFSIITTLEKATSPVTFKFEISSEKNETVASEEVTLPGQDGSIKLIDLKIGDLLDEAYNLTIRASDKDKSNEDRIILQRDLKNTSILIQTDKPIYKPGETVKFRVLVLNRFFQPFESDKAIDVVITDPQNNVIKSLKSVKIPGGRGYISDKFELSVEPNLGDWTIAAQLDNNKESETLRFTVDEYVLPKFKVDVTLSPSFLTYNDTKVKAEVSAIYSYGKPVKGKCTLTLSETGVYYSPRDKPERVTSIEKTIELEDQKGNAFIDFDVKNELTLKPEEVNKWGKAYNVKASCKDEVSGHIRNETSNFHIYKYPYKIEVVERPENIKPGFPVKITIKVSSQDGFPIGDYKPDALKIEHGFDFSEEGGIILTSIPPNGLVTIPFVAPKNPKVCYEALDVTFKELKESFWLPSKTVSPTGSYIQLKLLTDKPKENGEILVNVKTSKPYKSLNLILISRGVVIKSELLKSEGKQEQDISLTLPPKSAPLTNLVIYSVFPGDNIVIDTLKLDVQPATKNELEISVSDLSVEPGSNVSITVKGLPKSIVGLRAVDQSVLLLKQDNDITIDKLNSIAGSFKSYGLEYWGGSDVFQILTKSGLNILTNANIERGNSQWAPRPVYGFSHNKIFAMQTDRLSTPNYESMSFGSPPAAHKAVAQSANAGGGGGGADVRVRSFFPETWIWEELDNSEGKMTIHKPVPDTITSWQISGFQINQDEGLGLALTKPKLTVFRPFFISLNLPYSIVRGEVLGLQVLVHNYMEKPITAKVTLENKDSFFKFLEGDATDKMTKEINLNASSISSVTFPITPLKFGTMKLDVKAVTDTAGDAVSQPLIVKPPGIKHTQNSAILLNLMAGKSSQENVTAIFPEQRVPDADFLKVSVLGDILGGTMNNLDKLIRLPRGCGEQNMLNFVPDIVILDYLNTTGGLTPEIQRKAINYLEKGYQQQLTYLRYDGSYSVFGKSDPVGSTWLTAFVTRAFIQAQKYITIDDDVISRSLRFLVRQQNDNGSFAEEGYVHDRSLQGGAGSTQYALTAFTLLTFAEAQKSQVDLNKFSNESIMDKGVKFLLNGTSAGQLRDPYGVNLISYLLHLISHPKKDDYFKMTEDLASIDISNNTKYWKPIQRQRPTETQSKLTYRPWEPTPATVEMTSYGLLTYLLRGADKTGESVPIVKWLMKQRNAEGGFISTQDTVVGVTALAKFAEAISDSAEAEMNVKVAYNNAEGAPSSHDFYIGKDNKTTLQEFFLPLNVREVDLTSEGKGAALAQLTWTYYIEAKDTSPAFDLKVDLKDRDKGRILDMNVCTHYIRDKESNMAILEANAPSGYAFDAEELETLKQTQVFKRYELEDKDSKVNLYFNSLNGTEVCLNLQAYRIYLVAKHSKGVVSIYDYYDNTQKAQELYAVPAVSLCDICNADKSCEIKECASPKKD